MGRNERINRLKKKTVIVLLFLFIGIVSMVLLTKYQKKPLRVGVCVYNASVLKGIEENAQGKDAELLISEDIRDQNVQIQKIQEMIEQGIDVLIANIINRTSAVYLIQMAKEAGIAIVLVNSEPSRDDLFLYEDAYYVGSNAAEIGKMCGEMMADYYRVHPNMDYNKDGVLQLVILKGQSGHQDTEYRTRYALETLQSSGMSVEVLAEDCAEWEREIACQKMAVEIEIYGEKIEGVICNNDQMALGAIDALQAAGFYDGKRKVPVIGVDGLAQSAMDALEKGTLTGTVLNNTREQGKVALNLALQLAENQMIGDKIQGYPIEDGHYIWVTGPVITRNDRKENQCYTP